MADAPEETPYQSLYRRFRPVHLRRGPGPGPCRPRPAQCRPGRSGGPRLPVQRAPGHRQDLHGPDPGQGPQLHRPAGRRAVRGLPVLCGDHRGHLARCPRARRRLQQRGRRHARPGVPGGPRHPGPPEGLHRRRGPHALDGGIQRPAEDPGGAARPRRLRAGHHRPAEGAPHHPQPDPALRVPAPRPRHPGRAAGQVRQDAHLDVPDEALDLAVRRGRGSARDALSVLDQVAASDVGRRRPTRARRGGRGAGRARRRPGPGGRGPPDLRRVQPPAAGR